MPAGAQMRKDERYVPSLEINEKLLKILRDNPERELDEEQLRQIVRPMLDVIKRLVRENPEAAARGIRVTIGVKAAPYDAEYVGTSEVAKFFGVSQQQVRRWCEQGRIQGERTPGGTWRIPMSQFDGVGFIPPKAKRKRQDIRSVAGAWKGHEDLRRELEEGRD